MPENEFRAILEGLGKPALTIVKIVLYLRLYRRSIWLIGYPSSVILLSLWLAPGEKIVLFTMSVVSVVYARLAVKIMKW